MVAPSSSLDFPKNGAPFIYLNKHWQILKRNRKKGWFGLGAITFLLRIRISTQECKQPLSNCAERSWEDPSFGQTPPLTPSPVACKMINRWSNKITIFKIIKRRAYITYMWGVPRVNNKERFDVPNSSMYTRANHPPAECPIKLKLLPFIFIRDAKYHYLFHLASHIL